MDTCPYNYIYSEEKSELRIICFVSKNIHVDWGFEKMGEKMRDHSSATGWFEKKSKNKYVFLLHFPIILERRRQYQVFNLEKALFQSYYYVM